MNLADVLVSLVVIGLLILCFHLSKKYNKKGCGPCVGDCSTCSAFSNFYEDYKKDEEKKQKE